VDGGGVDGPGADGSDVDSGDDIGDLSSDDPDYKPDTTVDSSGPASDSEGRYSVPYHYVPNLRLVSFLPSPNLLNAIMNW
jgi:hypothetical protein